MEGWVELDAEAELVGQLGTYFQLYSTPLLADELSNHSSGPDTRGKARRLLVSPIGVPISDVTSVQ